MFYKSPKLLILSLTLNLIFIGLAGTFIARKGGVTYIAQKLSALNPSAKKEQVSSGSQPRRNTYRTSYYQLKTQNFKELPNSDQEIIFVGDSLIDQGEWTELIKNVNIINRGISGNTTDAILDRIDEIVESNPKKIFIMIGINDIWNESKSFDEIIANYEKILNTFKNKTPETQVYVKSILPINNQEYSVKINNKDIVKVNQKLQQLTQNFNYQYIDLYSEFLDPSNHLNPDYTPDGVHLNGKGYIHWSNLIKRLVNN